MKIEVKKNKMDDIRLRSKSQFLYATAAAISILILGLLVLACVFNKISSTNAMLILFATLMATTSFTFIALAKKREERRFVEIEAEQLELAYLADTFVELSESSSQAVSKPHFQNLEKKPR